MTKEKVIEVVAVYREVLSRKAYPPKRLTEQQMAMVAAYIPAPDRLDHMRWMCDEIVRLVEGDRTEKAMRWFGFLQAALWMFNLRTLEELKADNMPAEDVFDVRRV